MNKNSIPGRVADFLSAYPPFAFLPSEDLFLLAQQVNIALVDAGSIIFEQNHQPNRVFYFIRQGNIELLRDYKTPDEELIDVCDEGEIIGIRAHLAQDVYYATARAAEESLVYEIDFEFFKSFITKNAEVALYFAADFAAGSGRISQQRMTQQNSLVNLAKPAGADHTLFSFSTPLEELVSRRLVHCLATSSIAQAAALMNTERVGSIIITNELLQPVGIVTDTDFRKKLVPLQLNSNQPVSDLMTSPVSCVGWNSDLGEAFLKMLELSINHLVITEDGTANSPAQGVVTVHDLLLEQGNNPAVIMKQIARSDTTTERKRLQQKSLKLLHKQLDAGISITQAKSVFSRLNDALIRKELTTPELSGLFSSDACFVMMGSQAREEQVAMSDQDNALILGNQVEVNDFLAQADLACKAINQLGFEFCPSNMMANNPENCLTLNGWIGRFEKWIRTPEPQALLYATIFFDMRMLTGNENLLKQLQQQLVELTHKHKGFLNFLAQNALQNPPPLSFFRDFMVEKSGVHSDQFDLKSRALMPLVDAARVLSLAHKYTEHPGTLERYTALADLDTRHKLLYNEAAEAFAILLRHRALWARHQQNSGRFIPISRLSKLERQALRSTFKTIEAVQLHLKSVFSLDYFR